jgi:ubiquinol-cytochrome c reductase cytochrome c1 subunit
MLRPIALGAALSLGLAGGAAAATFNEITDYAFSYEGPFGSYDTIQLQRGLKVYTETCAACHGLSFVAFRTLSQEGGPELPEEQMRAFAAQFEVFDAALDDGEGGFRPAAPADHFPGSALATAPDLSLMAKARKGFEGPYGSGLAQLFNGMGGGEYLASLLTGYVEPPDCAPEDTPGYYNVAFEGGYFPESCTDERGRHLYPGSWIAMAPPLVDGGVTFDDGSPSTVEGQAVDVAAFLMWAAEPHKNARKQAGLTGIIFLTFLAVLLYMTNKRIWAPIKAQARAEGQGQAGRGDTDARSGDPHASR